MSDTPTYAQVLLPNGGVLHTLFLYETETCVVTRYGCFYKPDLSYARNNAVRLVWPSPLSS